MATDSRQLAIQAARCAYEKGGEDIAILALPAGAVFDYVVIANGRSERQAATLVDELYHYCKRHGIPHAGVEGEVGWRLLDCYEVVMHAFVPEARARYDLEGLWPEAERLDVDRALAESATSPATGGN